MQTKGFGLCRHRPRVGVGVGFALAGEATSFLDNPKVKTYRNLHQKHTAENATCVELERGSKERPNKKT